MDVTTLRGRIADTLSADPDARRRAELDLKAVSSHPLQLPGQVVDHACTG